MSIAFSDIVNNSGIVQQVRDLTRVDSTQWATQKITNSVNNYHDTVTGYAIGADSRFQWDDTNHTKLPIGTTAVTASSDYSFLTDEQGNSIITLTRIEYIDGSNNETRLEPIEESGDWRSLGESIIAGVPTGYYKIADNIIRLNYIPTAGTLRFYFQRTGSYFTAADTTKSPGVSPLLHRGYVIAAAYDCAFTLGLDNANALGTERIYEMEKMKAYFTNRTKDERSVLVPVNRSRGSH